MQMVDFELFARHRSSAERPVGEKRLLATPVTGVRGLLTRFRQVPEAMRS